MYEKAFKLANRFDAFQDNPWPILYEELDRKFPGSTFILTLRPSDQWIRSIVSHFSDEETPMREWIYRIGRPKANEDIYIAGYERHNSQVISSETQKLPCSKNLWYRKFTRQVEELLRIATAR